MTYTQALNPLTNDVHDSMIKRDADGAHIPFDNENQDYKEYLAWLKKGNEPNPLPSNPMPPIEQPPPPDINDVNAQVQDIDQRLSALEEVSYKS